VPGYRAIAADPRWGRWLQAIDPPTGRVRAQLLDDAIERGDAANAIMFFKQFQATGGRIPAESLSQPAATDKPMYTREEIRQAYELRRKGGFIGRDGEWDRLERDMRGRCGRAGHRGRTPRRRQAGSLAGFHH
jgi:hypothetical protein